MNKIIPIRINPICRLIWNTEEAKDAWEVKLYKSKLVLDKAKFEAYKRGILKTYGFWISRDDYDTNKIEKASEFGKCILSMQSGSPLGMEFTYYNFFNTHEGIFYLFSNEDEVPELPYELMKRYDLSLTTAYTNSNMANNEWYKQQILSGFNDPIGEMRDFELANHLLNPFFRHLGISVLPYIARSWGDEYSLDLANKIWDIVLEIDDVIAKDIENILKMPTKWDCWRGVSIVDTPIFKTIKDSVTYKENNVLEYTGSFFDVEGAAKGNCFPYINKIAEGMLKKAVSRNGRKGYSK